MHSIEYVHFTINRHTKEETELNLGSILHFLSFQPSAFPSLNTKLEWQTQQSGWEARGGRYLENQGRIIVGTEEWTLNQVLIEKANMAEQELVVKFNLASPSRDIDYAIEFKHEVRFQYRFEGEEEISSPPLGFLSKLTISKS